VGVIFMALAAPLYLSGLGVGVVAIGVIYLGITAFNAALVLILGMLGDRIGFKPILLISEFITAVSASVIGLDSGSIMLIALAMIAGDLGGTVGGLRGSFSPGSTALIANNWREDEDRIKKISRLTTVGSLFSILGSSLMILHGSLQSYVGSLQAFRILFLVSAGMLWLSFASLFFVGENVRIKKTTRLMKKSSFRYIARVIVANAMNGIGLGISIPLLPLWFALRFHAGTGEIGLLFTAANALTAAGAYTAGIIRNRFEMVRLAGYTRSMSGGVLILMAFSPLLPIAAAFYLLRQLVMSLGAPARSAVMVRGVNAEDYGTATSFQGVANRLSQGSSGLSGYLMSISLPAPLFVGGLFQVAGGIAYAKLLGKPKRE
jgi:MFS family permease